MTAEQSPNWGSYSQAFCGLSSNRFCGVLYFGVYINPIKDAVFFDTQNLWGTSHHISSKHINHPGKY